MHPTAYYACTARLGFFKATRRPPSPLSSPFLHSCPSSPTPSFLTFFFLLSFVLHTQHTQKPPWPPSALPPQPGASSPPSRAAQVDTVAPSASSPDRTAPRRPSLPTWPSGSSRASSSVWRRCGGLARTTRLNELDYFVGSPLLLFLFCRVSLCRFFLLSFSSVRKKTKRTGGGE